MQLWTLEFLINKTMEQKDFSFKKYAWHQFKKNKPALISFYILIALVFVALFAPVIANDQPLYCKYKGETFYPAFSTLINPSKLDSVTNSETGITETLSLTLPIGES